MDRTATWNAFSRHLVRMNLAPLPAPPAFGGFMSVIINQRSVALAADQGQVRIGRVGFRPDRVFRMGKNPGKMKAVLDALLAYVLGVGDTPEVVRQQQESARIAYERKQADQALLERQRVAQRDYQGQLAAIVAPPGGSHGYRKVDPKDVPDGQMPVRVTFEGNLSPAQIRALYRAWQEVLLDPGEDVKKATTAYDHLDGDE